MGRDDARDLAMALIAACEGIALLAATLRDPGLISREGDRLEPWIGSLEGSPEAAAGAGRGTGAR
jgi:TetR/AcrR family transcriptional regulator, transcriptional repressor for nem operon